MKGTVTKVIDPSKRSGSGAKGAWNIMTVEVEKPDGSLVNADSFDTLVDGDIVELEPNNYTNPNTGKTYNGWNARIPKAGAPAPSSQSNAELLQAIRLVFREVKVISANVKALVGPDEAEAGSDETTLVLDQEEASPAAPARNWQDVGKAHDEPLPEPPEDLETYMNS